MLGSTVDSRYMFCISTGRFLDDFHIFFYVAVDLNPVACVSVLTQNGEVCLSRCFSLQSCSRCAHLENCTLFLISRGWQL